MRGLGWRSNPPQTLSGIETDELKKEKQHGKCSNPPQTLSGIETGALMLG